jgi:hypothetical protein
LPNQSPFSPLIRISPQYRAEYERLVNGDSFYPGETVVAAFDFAENYFGSSRHFHWGFVVLTNVHFIRCFSDEEPGAAVVYAREGSLKDLLRYGQSIKKYKWVDVADLAPPGGQVEMGTFRFSSYELGDVLLWRDASPPYPDREVWLTELMIVPKHTPEELEYYLTFKQEDGFLAYNLLLDLRVWNDLQTVRRYDLLTAAEAARAETRFWRFLAERVGEITKNH